MGGGPGKAGAAAGLALALAALALAAPTAGARVGRVFAAPIRSGPVTVSCATGGRGRATVAVQVAFADVRPRLDRRLAGSRGRASLALTLRGAQHRVLARAHGSVAVGTGYRGNHGYLSHRFRLGRKQSARLLRYALGRGSCSASPRRSRSLRAGIGVRQVLPVPVALGGSDRRAVTRARLGARVRVVPVRRAQASSCLPYPCYKTAAEVLAWQPSGVGPFDRATAPLAERPPVEGPKMLVGLDNGPWAYWSDSDLNSQGSSATGNVFNFPNWQYVDLFYYYSHNLLSVPPTVWINAAHRNGVPVLGTMTSDCTPCDTEMNTLFEEHEQAAVRILYELAAAYGFDGWVIDVERLAHYSAGLLGAMKKLGGMELNGRPLIVTTYEAKWHHLAPKPVVRLEAFLAAGTWQADYITAGRVKDPSETSRFLTERGLDARSFDAYWASYVYEYPERAPTGCAGGKSGPTFIWNGKACLDTAKLFQNLGSVRKSASSFYQSAALFAPDWTMFAGRDKTTEPPPPREQVADAESRLWSGVGGYRLDEDGSCVLRQDDQNAVSSLIAPRPTLTTVPFLTNFDTGEGDSFYVGGKRVGGEWNLLSAQDAVPSEQCTDGSSLAATPDYGAALDGGSSLLVQGEVFPSGNSLYLFEARAPLSSQLGFTLAYCSLAGSEPRVVVWVNGNGPIFLDTKTIPSVDGWTHTVATLPPGTRGLLTRVGIAFGGAAVEQVSAQIGELGVVDLSAGPAPALIQPKLSRARLDWVDPDAKRTRYFNVWARSRQGCLRFVGRTLLTGYDLFRPLFAPIDIQPEYIVQPVTNGGLEAALSPPPC
jgi:mannosyl-glycoprotein endo-beta-N-acetylglucosaminidase